MTAVPQPPHPVGELPTWQLRDYRTALESALTEAPEHSADKILIERRLAQVRAEQNERITASMRVPYADVYRRLAGS